MLTIVVYFQTSNNIRFCIWKAKLLMNIAIWYFIPILYSCPIGYYQMAMNISEQQVELL